MVNPILEQPNVEKRILKTEQDKITFVGNFTNIVSLDMIESRKCLEDTRGISREKRREHARWLRQFTKEELVGYIIEKEKRTGDQHEK